MSTRIWPALRRMGVAAVLGLALVSAACTPGGQVPPVQITVLSPTPGPAGVGTPVPGTPVAGAQAIPVVLTANASGNSITLYDPSTKSVIETIDVGFPARSVAVTPDGRYAFVVNGASGANSIAVFDLITKSRVSDITVGTDPTAIEIASDGKYAFVANSGSNNVSILDVPMRTNIGNVTVGPRPVDLISTTLPSGTTVYVVDQGGNQVSVIRLGAVVGTPVRGAPTAAAVTTPSAAMTATAAAGASPAAATTPGAAVSPTVATSQVTGASPTAVGAASPTTAGAVIATIPVGINPVAITGVPGGTRLYVANQGSGDVSVIDTSTNRESARIPVGGRLTGLAISPNATVLFVTMDQPASRLAEVDLSTNKVTRTIPVGAGPSDVTFSADGKLAFVSDRVQNSLTVIDTATGRVVSTNTHHARWFQAPR
jgi:YVTN family beta-propeller protein